MKLDSPLKRRLMLALGAGLGTALYGLIDRNLDWKRAIFVVMVVGLLDWIVVRSRGNK